MTRRFLISGCYVAVVVAVVVVAVLLVWSLIHISSSVFPAHARAFAPRSEQARTENSVVHILPYCLHHLTWLLDVFDAVL